MTQDEKLKKIIEKALPFTTDYWNGDVLKEISDVEIRGQYNLVYLQGGSFVRHINLYELIFSKDFLKAFFGERLPELKTRNGEIWYPTFPAWKYYAQELVLEDDKIDYLYKKI